MAEFHNDVRLSKFPFPDSQLTVNLASGITATHIGLAVTQDTSADNQVKLAGDGDPIFGILYTVENRVTEGTLIGTVEFRFAAKLAIKTGLTGGAAVARGKRLIGAGAGEVKAITEATAAEFKYFASAPVCWSVEGTKAIAHKI